MMTRVVAVCGMPGSGKGEFAALLEAAGIPVVSMGDMIRAEVRLRGLDEAPHVFGEVAADLRAKHGEDVLAVRLCDRVDELLDHHALVLIEGLRGTAEDAVFSARWAEDYRTVAIVADADLRFERIQHRGRSEDGDREAFETRNQRELGWGLDVVMAEADDVLSNQADLQAFQTQCGAWLNQVLSLDGAP
jgi:dephospho-CoA kinase